MLQQCIKYEQSKILIDKYKPQDFKDIKYSCATNEQLQSLITKNNMPHIILKGFRGCGKKTRSLLFLKEKYNHTVFNLNTLNMEFKLINKKNPIVLTVLYSPFHYQINLSQYGVYDRIILELFLKEIINFKPINNIPYKIIIIEDADTLSIEAQQSLRRTLETKIQTTRFIFIVNYEYFFIEALYSRCIVIPVVSPGKMDIFNIINNIAKEENITLTNKQYNDIINNSNNNINTAITILNNYQTTNNIHYITDNNLYLSKLANIILNIDKHLNDLNDIRIYLNKLLINTMTDIEIMKNIFKLILKLNKDNNKIYKIISISSKIDILLKNGNKSIYYLELYCVKLTQLFI
jgi:replication factor C subunit 3/5